ncbi:MAG: phytanoyl-CoA dioxygenase family protein, partial [Roseomonas sp.]|nr:phytanoyl-CoA dioxygenase family protein [Roseomonas sp.]
MGVLTQEQKDAFWRDGCLVVPNAVSPDLLARLRAEIAGWVEE